MVAKRKADPYRRGVHWYKIKNPAYTQAEGRGELFNRQRSASALKPRCTETFTADSDIPHFAATSRTVSPSIFTR
jgi:hypothetical protein